MQRTSVFSNKYSTDSVSQGVQLDMLLALQQMLQSYIPDIDSVLCTLADRAILHSSWNTTRTVSAVTTYRSRQHISHYNYTGDIKVFK